MNRFCFFFVFATVLLPPDMGVGACGVNWTVPFTRTPWVEENGYISYSFSLGTLTLGDGYKVPIAANFKSNRQRSSAYFGKGWQVPILEAHLEPVSEDSFVATMPDGWLRRFWKDKDRQNIYRDSEGWIAEASESQMVMVSPCGWRLVYRNGHLDSIRLPNGRLISLVRSNGVVVALGEGAKTLLEVKGVGGNSATVGDRPLFLIDDVEVPFTLSRRPIVEKISGLNVIGRMEDSLSSIDLVMGERFSFKYGTDEELNPTMELESSAGVSTSVGWDSATQKSLFVKINGKAVKDNPEKVKYEERMYFQSGPLRGKLRAIERYRKSKLIGVKRFVYNERSQLVRVMEGDKVDLQQYYGNDGRLIKKVKGDGKTITYTYLEDGRKKIQISHDDRQMVAIEDLNGDLAIIEQ